MIFQGRLLIQVLLIAVFIFNFQSSGLSAGTEVNDLIGTQSHVYVAPSVIQVESQNVFTTFTFTNPTPFWFNPLILLLDREGEILKTVAPLVKGFGTWQEVSSAIVSEDFQGSIWIISPQPLVGFSFIHQIKKDGSLSMLGNAQCEEIEAGVAEAALLKLSGN